MVGGIFLAAFAQSYEALVISQIIAGIADSTYHPTGMSLISDFESNTTEGKAMGVFGFFGMAGIAGAPLVIGGLAGIIDWRFGLAVAAALGFVFTIVFALLFEDPGGDADDSSTATGEHIAATGTAAAADTKLRKQKAPTPDETPQSSSSIDIDQLRERLGNVLRVPLTTTVVLLLIMTVLVSLQTRAIMTFTTSYVAESTGGTATLGNAIFFVMLVSGSVSSLWAGSLADRVHRGRLGLGVSVATTAVLISTYLLVTGSQLLPEELLVGTLVGLFAVLGLAMYACVPVKNAIISSQAKREFSGSLFGMTQTTSAIGSATGPALFGFIATEFGMAIAYPLIGGVSVLIGALFILLTRDP